MREKWPGDIDVALAYLEAQPGVTRGTVGAGGASCGVNMAIRLAQRRAEVKSLVLLSTPILYRSEREFVRKAKGLPNLYTITPAATAWRCLLNTKNSRG
jgi:dienelactone hydrolase